MKQGEALHRYSLAEPPALSERSEDNPFASGYPYGPNFSDRNCMIGDRMAFTKGYYIYMVIPLFKNLYQAGHQCYSFTMDFCAPDNPLIGVFLPVIHPTFVGVRA